MGLSVSLDIATSALRAQQLGVDVTSHNIANANTVGFSRQEVAFRAAVSQGTSLLGRNLLLGQSGLGVNASEVRRLRDQFVDFQIRSVLQSFGQYDAQASALDQAEVIFNEPSTGGLTALFATFWNAWRDLSNSPESAAARANVIAESQTLTTAIRRTYDQLRALQRDLDSRITVAVTQVNTVATQIAALNEQIVRVQVSGGNASDLEDKRDLLLNELSQLVNTTITKREDGSVTVLVGSRELISGNRVEALTVQGEASNFGYKSVRWSTDTLPAEVTSGELYGLQQARDVSLAASIVDLNALIAQVITQVNAVHTTGFGLDNSTGLAFFTGANAADMAVNPVVVGDTNKLAAASAANLPGDARKALALADLQNALTMSGGTARFDDYYSALIGRLGVSVQEARSLASNQEFLKQHMETLRESVAGVSLDEEMTNLIKFQHAFEAAAQLISVVDSMLDTLVNRVGLAGR